MYHECGGSTAFYWSFIRHISYSCQIQIIYTAVEGVGGLYIKERSEGRLFIIERRVPQLT